jgi:hypothetical protein
MERSGADFRPLIAALEAASADPFATLEQQLANIELSLVSAQLNPNPIEAVELAYSLRALREIDPQGISSTRGTADLAPWFEQEA